MGYAAEHLAALRPVAELLGADRWGRLVDAVQLMRTGLRKETPERRAAFIAAACFEYPEQMARFIAFLVLAPHNPPTFDEVAPQEN